MSLSNSELSKLESKGIITSASYWKNNAKEGGTVDGEYAELALRRTAALIKDNTLYA